MNHAIPATTEARVYGALLVVVVVALVVFVVLWRRAVNRAADERRLRRRAEFRETTAKRDGHREGYRLGRTAGIQLARDQMQAAFDNVVNSAAADDPDAGDVTQKLTRPGEPGPVRTADATVEFDRVRDDVDQAAT